MLALPLLAGCGNLADRGLAARAGDWTLVEERLAELLVLAQPFPLDSAAVHEVASHWVGAAALVLRSAAGDSLLGSEALEAGIWLDRREALLTADREARLGAGAEVDAASAAEVFREGELRLVAHTLRRAGPEASSSECLQQQRAAERLLATLVEGGSWDRVVAESEDAETRGAAGLLGLFARNELPSTLDRVVFRLEPGQVVRCHPEQRGLPHPLPSPLRRGWIAVHGPVAAASAGRSGRRGQRGGTGVPRFAMLPGAVTVLGRMAGEPVEWLGSAHPLAEWEGGVLAASVVARYLLYFPPQSLAELAAAGEEERVTLIRDLGTRELRLADAGARAGLLSPALEEAFVQTHADEIEHWGTALELGAPDSPSRAALARYMESLVSRQTDGRSLPPLLEAWLLARTDHKVRVRGVLAAIVIARGMLAETGGGAGQGR